MPTLTNMVKHLKKGSNPRAIPASFLKLVARILDGMTPVTRDNLGYKWVLGGGAGGGAFSGVAVWPDGSRINCNQTPSKRWVRVCFSAQALTEEDTRPSAFDPDEYYYSKDTHAGDIEITRVG